MYRICILIVLLCLSADLSNAQTIDWLSLKEAQSRASENKKKVMIFAEAEWCSYCKRMNKEVFSKQSVVDSLGKYFYPVRLDIESNKEVTFNNNVLTEKSLARKFRALRTPTTIFLNSEGAVIGTQPGFWPEKIFNKLLAYVGSDLYNQLAFEKYLSNHGIKL